MELRPPDSSPVGSRGTFRTKREVSQGVLVQKSGPVASARPGREYRAGPAIVRMTDALQGQRGAPPQDPPGALPGDQLAGIRQGTPAARQLDGVGDAGSLGGLAPAQHGPTGPLARLFGPRH